MSSYESGNQNGLKKNGIPPITREFEKVMRERAVDNTVMITVFDSGFFPQFMSYYYSSLLPLNIKNFVAITLDYDAYTVWIATAGSCVYVEVQESEHSHGSVADAHQWWYESEFRLWLDRVHQQGQHEDPGHHRLPAAGLSRSAQRCWHHSLQKSVPLFSMFWLWHSHSERSRGWFFQWSQQRIRVYPQPFASWSSLAMSTTLCYPSSSSTRLGISTKHRRSYVNSPRWTWPFPCLKVAGWRFSSWILTSSLQAGTISKKIIDCFGILMIVWKTWFDEYP